MKLWSVDEWAYVDTLFGHQADVLAIAPLPRERCATAGRDRTARLWKIPEQTQLVFRSPAADVSTEAVAAISETWFVTGGQDGSLSLWHAGRKKPVFTRAHAHGDGVAPPQAGPHALALPPPPPPGRAAPEPLPASDAPPAGPAAADLPAVCAATGARPGALTGGYCAWVTALAWLPNSDVVVSGSGDGWLRFWRLSAQDGGEAEDGEAPAASHGGRGFRSLQPVASLPVRGIVNGLSASADGSVLVAAVGQEHRLGRWWRYRGAANGALVLRLPFAAAAQGEGAPAVPSNSSRGAAAAARDHNGERSGGRISSSSDAVAAPSAAAAPRAAAAAAPAPPSRGLLAGSVGPMSGRGRGGRGRGRGGSRGGGGRGGRGGRGGGRGRGH